jgi:clan AA aspartic protease (TIGR02281 family)
MKPRLALRFPAAMRAIAHVLVLVLSGAGAMLLAHPARAEVNACYQAAVAKETRAATLCSAMASQGDAIAQRILGYLYDVGQSVPQNDAQAARWYMRASNQGDSGAQCNLAGLYSDGRGVEQDYAKAAFWARKGVAGINGIGCAYVLGTLYRDGTGVEQDYAKARSWFERAAAATAAPFAAYARLAKAELAKLSEPPPAPAVLPAPAVVRAVQRGGSFEVDGLVDGAAARFLVDTGANVTAVDIQTLEHAGLKPIDMTRLSLANGSEDDALVYIVPRLCIGDFCVSDMRVVAGVSGLLGVDFLKAAQVEVNISDGVMTLTGRQ